jgi:PAS domain S-box-containing protein
MRILVVDDHDLVRKGIRSVLAGQPVVEVCGEAVDGRDAIEKAKACLPDLIVMDISMPNMNGLEATREIKRLQPETRVIMVSQHESPEMVRQAFNAGANGYVVKASIAKDLITAIQKADRKEPFLSAATIGENGNLDANEILRRSAAFEKALRESEERFRSAMNNMAEGLFTTDTSGIVTYINPAGEAILGWSSPELLGRNMHTVTHYKRPDGTRPSAEDWNGFGVLRSGAAVREQEDLFIHRSGRFFPVVYSASPIQQGGKTVGLVVCFRDDTKRREAEESLRRSERIYRTIGESIDYGIWISDATGRTIYASPSFLQLVGITQEQCSSLGWQHALHPEDITETQTAWQECLRTGGRWEREVRLRTAAGGWRYVMSRSGPVRDAEGKITHWAGIFLDIQHRKESEAALSSRIAERTEALQKASDELRKLSGTLLQTQDEERRRIARELHDGIGQLLAAMGMNISGVDAEKQRLSPVAREALGQTTELIQQASQEIRTMSHLLHPPLLDEVGLESALQWYVTGFSERSKIDVTIHAAEGFSDGLPRELALALFRIVQEGLTNVHRHSESRTAQVEIQRSPEEIVVEVRDQGKGISEDLQNQIFSGASLGVGLRGMRERTRQFEGKLEVYSAPGDTRIRAVLPVDKATPGDVSEDAALPESSTASKGGTILCVDDEETALLTRRMLLESAGHHVLEARSGPEGLEVFQAEKVDVVILDYWMSGMKGTSVAAEMKRINPLVPIIVLSGVSDLPGEGSGWVDQWLIKGTHKAEHLLDSVSTLLERKLV